MKTCSKCKVEKDLTCFSFTNKKILKYHSACKDCNKCYSILNKDKILNQQRIRRKNDTVKAANSKYKKKYYETNKDKIKSDNAEHNKKYARTITGRFIRFKSQSKRRNIDVTLTLQEYCKIIKNTCYYCDYKLGKPVETTGGLDRLDNSKGYILDNCVSCCADCNYIKGDILTVEETKAAVKAILQVRYSQQSAGN